MFLLALTGSFEIALPEGGEAVVNLVLENQTDTALKEPWIFVFSKPDWLSVSPDSVITGSLAKGEKIELQPRIRAEGHDSWIPWVSREGELKLRVLVRNGEVAPDFIDFKVKEEPAEFASLVPWLLAREYEFTHTLTEHYDYYPIVFLHGSNATARSWLEPGFEEDFDDSTALEKLIDSNYNGYGAAVLSLYAGDPVPPTYDQTYPKRQIYNAGYYTKGFVPNSNDIQGVIGSHDKYFPSDEEDCANYTNCWGSGEYSNNVGRIIPGILEATYSDKVHVVAHSMGGIVLRAAIKYYPHLQNEINRVLMLATPNQGLHYTDWQEWIAYTKCPHWMIGGELAELKLRDVEFVEGKANCGSGNPGVFWIDLLNQDEWPGTVKYATIGGLLNNRIGGAGPSDGLIDAGWVHWSPASFNATHYSSHGSMKGDGFFSAGRSGEASMMANEFVTEYIKTWLIDGDVSKIGPIHIEDTDLPRTWNTTQEPLMVGIKTSNISKIISIEVLINFGGMFIDAGGASYRVADNRGNNWYYFNVIPRGYYNYSVEQYGARLIIYNLEGIAYETDWGIGIGP